MIYTQYGSEVEIIASNEEKTMVNVKFVEDGFIDTKSVIELKADGGINEIMDAINKLIGG